jgi:hypothetical protein
MDRRDTELLSRISQVNQVTGDLVVHVLTGIADDDALSGDFASIGEMYTQLGKAFLERAAELGEPPPARLVG